jgi:hypothetical protein
VRLVRVGIRHFVGAAMTPTAFIRLMLILWLVLAVLAMLELG